MGVALQRKNKKETVIDTKNKQVVARGVVGEEKIGERERLETTVENEHHCSEAHVCSFPYMSHIHRDMNGIGTGDTAPLQGLLPALEPPRPSQ